MKVSTKEEIEKLIGQNKDRYYAYALYRKDKDEIFYIGKGKKDRIFVHEYEAKKQTECKSWRQRIIRKLDFDLLYLIKFVDSEQEAFEWEKKLIARHGRSRLCNMTDGGEGASGMVMGEEARRKISLYQSQRKRTEEEKRKMSLSQTGKKMPEEAKKKLSLLNKGKIMSEEAKRKMSLSQTGKKMPEEAKRRISIYQSERKHPKCSEEQKKKTSEKMKGMIACLDIASQKRITISVEEFRKLKNVRYFSTSSKFCINWKKEKGAANEQ